MTEKLLTWVLVAGVMAGTVAAIYWARNRDEKAKGPRRASKNGNTAAVLRLLRYTAANIGGKVIEAVELQKDGDSYYFDGVLIGCFGVYAVQCYGHNGQIYGNPKDKQWLWVSANKRESMANPVDQAEQATRVLRECLIKAGLRNPECEVGFVFTDARAELCVPRSVSPMKTKDLRKQLGKEKYRKDKGFDTDRVSEILTQYVKQ